MQPPFVQSGPDTHKGHMDPAARDKDKLEAEMLYALERFFQDQRLRVREALYERVPDDRKGIQLPLPFWNDEGRKLLSVLLPFLQRGAEGGVETQRAIIDIEVDWTQPFTEAADWARKHAGTLIRGITDTTRERVRSVVGNWIESTDHTFPDLWKQLMEDHAFSRSRAQMIAATESTRAYAEGEMVGAEVLEKEGWYEYDKRWDTARDDRVCPICAPMDGVVVHGVRAKFDTLAGALEGPPAHPRCRCGMSMVPVIPK